MELLTTLKTKALTWLEHAQILLQEPSSYMQCGVVAAAMIAAFCTNLLIQSALPNRKDNSPELPVWLKALAELKRLIFPVLTIITLTIAQKLSPAIAGKDLFVTIAQKLSILWLIFAFLRHIVRHPVMQKIGFWVLIPAAFLSFFGWLDNVVTTLDSYALTLSGVRISAYGMLKMLLAATVLFWLGGASNKSGQHYIRSRENLGISTRELLAKLFEIGVYVLIFLSLLKIVGIDLTALAVLGGAVGVGIGFGLQSIASNFISGIILLLEKSATIGDVIELEDGTFGILKKMGARASIIETYDGKEVMVPNETFISSKITNWTHSSPKVRYEIPFGVSYDTDIHKIPPIVEAAVSSFSKVLVEPEKPECELQEFGDSSVNFTVEFWVEGVNDGKNRFTSDIMFLIWDALKENNISIPYPQRDIHIISGKND